MPGFDPCGSANGPPAWKAAGVQTPRVPGRQAETSGRRILRNAADAHRTAAAKRIPEIYKRGPTVDSQAVLQDPQFIGYNTANPLFSGVENKTGDCPTLLISDSIVNSTIYSRGKASNIPINPSSIFYYDTSTKFKPDEILTTQHLGNDKWGLDNDGKYVRHVGAQKQVLQFEILTNSDSAEKG